MKKWILAIILGLTFVSCQTTRSPNPWRQSNGKLKILSTIAMIDDIVKQVGGEHIDSMPLIGNDLDPHSYELVKGDDEKFTRASIIFYNGLGLEHGLSLRQNLERNPKAVAVGDFIAKEDLLIVDRQTDPHIWMDISLWSRIIEPIVEALCEKDPMHQEDYRLNAQQFKEKMLHLDKNIYRSLQKIPESKRYLVTSHDAFHYFTRRYLAAPNENEKEWEVRCAAPEGLAPDAQLSVTDLQKIIDHIVKYKVSVLFPEANVNKDSLKKIISASKEKGALVRLSFQTLYGDSMGNESYLKMIFHNAEVILQELGGEYEESTSP